MTPSEMPRAQKPGSQHSLRLACFSEQPTCQFRLNYDLLRSDASEILGKVTKQENLQVQRQACEDVWFIKSGGAVAVALRFDTAPC